MIYVPDYEDGQCAYMYSNNILRVYDSTPSSDTTINYTDYMVDNHYLYREGSTTFTQYSNIPICLSDDSITTNFGYRTDISDILITFTLIVGIIYFIISRLWRALFKGGRVLWDSILVWVLILKN